MKRIVYILWSAATLCGCQKSEVFDKITHKGEPISFHTSIADVQTLTRAAESSNEVLQNAAVKNTGTPLPLFVYKGDNSLYFEEGLSYNSNVWETAIERFMPESSSLNVYSYYSTDVVGIPTFTGISNYTAPTGTNPPKFDYSVAQTGGLDLIAAKSRDITETNILISYRHILSQINFGVQGKSDYCITISNIRINNILQTGTFNYENWKWDNQGAEATTYNYLFPDGTIGSSYTTTGSDTDDQNMYIYGDGGNFGPGSEITKLYAQSDNSFKPQSTSQKLHNSLMLMPQAITSSTNAEVMFDYLVTKGGNTIISGSNATIDLSTYYDWAPNLRYLYLFDVNIPTNEVTFKVLINPWQNWDATEDDPGNGLVNATIQQPTALQLNSLVNNSSIYLFGRLERDLIWDWSDETKYTFDISAFKLDFSNVNMGGYKITILLPDGYVSTGSAKAEKETIQEQNGDVSAAGKLVISKEPAPTKPTNEQLNAMVNSAIYPYTGTLTSSLDWDFTGATFDGIRNGESIILDVSGVGFGANSITITLPSGYIGDGYSSVNVSNRTYTLSSGASQFSIMSQKAAMPTASQVNDLISGETLLVGGGEVASNLIWNYITEPNIMTIPHIGFHQSFTFDFMGVNIGSYTITLNLPRGIIANGASVLPLSGDNAYDITDGVSEVVITNKRIVAPRTSEITSVVNGSELRFEDGFVTSVQTWDWSSYNFANLAKNDAFTVSFAENVTFDNNVTITMPNGYTPSTVVFNASNRSQLFTNSNISAPSDVELNSVTAGGTIAISGSLGQSQNWDWSTKPLSGLGHSDSFTLSLSAVTFNSNTIEITLPVGCTVTGSNITHVTGTTYNITGPTTMTITDNAYVGNPTATPFITANAGESIVVKGTLNSNWDWTGAAKNFGVNLSAGQSMTLDTRRATVSAEIAVVDWEYFSEEPFAKFTITNAGFSGPNSFTFNAPGVITFTKK